MGPLPRSDRNSELQELSLNLFRSALPPDKFVFRDERTNDLGVDGSLELKIRSRGTNLRAQVQLKATESIQSNQDGSISVQVTTANLNYLLNGPSPLYVLALFPSGELRFLWARDERLRLDSVNQNWLRQDYVTIRFRNRLDADSIDEIHERIQKEARLQRSVTEALATASNTDSVIVSIDPVDLKLTDPLKAQTILESSGTLIVTAGYPEEIHNLTRLLDLQTARLPRILLVRAYADYMLGRYPGAYALLSEAMMRPNELSLEDKQFLEFLRDGCDYQSGRLTLEQMAARIKAAKSGDGRFALSQRLTQLRYDVLLQREREPRATALETLRTAVSQVLKMDDTSEAFKLYAKEALLEAEGYNLTRDFLMQLGEARMGLQLGRDPNLGLLWSEHSGHFLAWEREMIALIHDAVQLKHPLLIASTTLVRASVHHMFLTNHRSSGIMFNLPVQVSENAVQSFITSVQGVVSIYVQAGQFEGELRSKLLIADFLDLIDHTADAKAIAQEILPKAQALGYAVISARAEAHISGDSLQHKIRTSWILKKSDDERSRETAKESDQEMRRNAAQMLRVLDLPKERLPVLERTYASIRDAAKQQVSWCKHLDLLENKFHELSPSTMYKVDPPRAAICKRYGYRSLLQHPDWVALFDAFKKMYCEGCKEREPLS